ncbi:MAG: transglutaminaseTgpA domain-containing protein [Polyangiales bacterium]
MIARRVVFALPALIVAAMVIAGTRTVEHGVGLGALVLGAAFVGPRVRMTAESQNVVAGVMLAPAAILVGLFTHDDPNSTRLDGVLGAIASWSALACASRLVMAEPAWGGRSLLAFGAVGALLAGYADLGSLYLALAWAFVAASLAAMRATDPARPPLASLPPRAWAAGAALALATLGAASLSAWGLPRLHAWVVDRYMRTSHDTASSGFSPWLELGPMRSMALSEEEVLRVHGPAPSYLRGTAYDIYDRGRWRTTHNATLRTVPLARGPLAGGDVTRVERLGGINGWYFVPLGVGEAATRLGAARRDAIGTVRGVPGDRTRELWFRRGGDGSALAPSLPTLDDRAVPTYVRPALTALAARWTVGVSSDAARMDALRRRLREDYSYSLRFERTPGLDPVVDFLTRHREGHCEYFASALALLGRAAGVPTRVAGGYRVGERHPYAGYRVVREKNAHAWVEAWVDGAWRTYDATPAGALPYNEPHDGPRWRAQLDLALLRLKALRAWAAGEGVVPLSVAAVVLLVAWLAWRVWRYRDRDAASSAGRGALDRALPCLDALDAALAGRGLPRAPGETLDRYAGRVAASELAARGEAAEALRRYAALRYGAEGDEGEVAAAMLRAARSVGEGGPARPAA